MKGSGSGFAYSSFILPPSSFPPFALTPTLSRRERE
jgi:hypothetical protein